MTLSRWKIMAAGLGVSLGGLAAFAGQCPKDVTKSGPVADAPPTLEAPVIQAAASSPAAPPKAMPPTDPSTIPVPDLPPLPSGAVPSLPTPPAAEPVKLPDTPVKLPDTPVSSPAMPPVLPAGGAAPMKVAPPAVPSPDLPDVGVPIVPMRATPMPGKPMPPADKPAPATPPAPPAPASDLKPPSEPPAPPAGLTYPKPTPPTTAPSDPLIGSPRVSPPSPNRGPDVPAFDPPAPPPTRALTVPDGGTTSMEIKHAQLATKFRILLRVGEGEPTFEVRCGDDLVLKVACEKVDVKSPEKGSGLSAVKASGKVRFAGFGAEGTCDELSFLAGSGEVVLAGGVNIKVKDKLGRIESELSAESAKYKLDPCPTGSR